MTLIGSFPVEGAFLSGGEMSRRAKMAAMAEKKQQRIDASLVSEVFPGVSKISIGMLYNKTGVLEPLSRTVNFFPGSLAIFRVNCLCSECVEGGFDFTGIIGSMIGSRKTASKGKISCDSCSTPECLDVAYTVTIKYVQKK